MFLDFIQNNDICRLVYALLYFHIQSSISWAAENGLIVSDQSGNWFGIVW
jgi:hypothetical protein